MSEHQVLPICTCKHARDQHTTGMTTHCFALKGIVTRCDCREYTPVAPTNVTQDTRDVTESNTTEWLPIESAPRDGSHVLIAMPGTFGVCGAQDRVAIQTVAHWWSNPGEEGWYASLYGAEQPEPYEPTHWKPLDSPPPVPSVARPPQETNQP